MVRKEETSKEALWHSTSHVMADAVKKLWPNVKLAIGPAIDDGFYYDFDKKEPFTPEDLVNIEKEMKKIIAENLDFKQVFYDRKEAEKLLKAEPYKLEMFKELPDKKISFFQHGKFLDMCIGPHIKNSKEIKAFKLLTTSTAYWKGDSSKKMLQRIYGISFESQKELDDYLNFLEEAKKRDHRKLGKELNLFTFSELIGSGLPLYTPKGALLRRLINDYVESIQSKEGYTQVWTPQIAKAELFKISGHYDKYKDSMFRVSSNYSNEEFFLKPMNCPQHTQIYSSQPRSYRDLPIRLTDFAMLYRDEKPGELSGLARVRSFSQDDCHIFCTEDQVDEEVDKALEMTKKILSVFGLKYKYRLSTRDPEHPEKYIGDPKLWDKVEKWAEKIMKRNKIEHFQGPGEAAFYAPKMDLIATDCLGREWQLSTIQLDFFLPERFDLKYTDKDGKEKRPVMIHRAILGSPERFLMVLIEHFAGKFPTWLSPVQVKVLTLTDDNIKYAEKVVERFKEAGLRVEGDFSSTTVQAKIRDAQMEKVPYTIVIGKKEEDAGTLAVRKRGEDKPKFGIKTDDFLKNIKKEIDEKVIG